MSLQHDRSYKKWTIYEPLDSKHFPSRPEELSLLPTKISLCTRSYRIARHGKVIQKQDDNEPRPLMTLHVGTPSPTAYNPPINPPMMTTSPAYTMRPKTYPEKVGGDRVSWGKEWFSDSSRWLIRADFDVRNTWPSPSDHVPRPTIGETLMTSHTAPSHSMAARKEFTLVSKDAKSFPSPCLYDRSRSQNNVLVKPPSFTMQQGRRDGTLPHIFGNSLSPGPGSYNPNIFKTSSKIRRPAFTISKSPRVIGITRNCSF